MDTDIDGKSIKTCMRITIKFTTSGEKKNAMRSWRGFQLYCCIFKSWVVGRWMFNTLFCILFVCLDNS